MGMPVELLVAETDDAILIDNYTDYGLLIFNGNNTLWLTVGLYPGNDGKAYCNRRIKLCIDPVLPSTAKFTAMFVNKTGSRVAISSTHSVFVIEIPNDFWCRQSVTVHPLTEHLQSVYHCRSQCVGTCIKSAPTAVDILKIRWYWKEKYDYGHRICNKLAVLYGGSIVRIYDTDVTCATPTLLIDFRSILGLSDLSSTRALGIYNYIASFDFGPSFVFGDAASGEQTRLKTLFAIDNDSGDIYVAVYSNDKVLEMQGPLPLIGTEPCDVASGDAFDMLYLQYRESSILPVFSLLSSKGRIRHFVAIAADQDTYDGRLEFVLTSYDNLLLPCKPTADVTYCLQNDPVQPGQYFVFCGTNLFSVDIRPWAYSLSNLLLTDASSEKNLSDLLVSKVQHIFRVLGGNEKSGPRDIITVATTVNVASDECFSACVDAISDNVFDDKNIAFVAATSSKQILSNFTKQVDVWDLRAAAAAGLRRTPVERAIDDLLLKECLKILQSQIMVPKFRLNKSVTEAEAIAVASAVVDALMTNMKITKVAFEKAQNLIVEDIKSLEEVNKEKTLCTERLLRVLSAYVDLKNRIYKIQRTVAKLRKRGDENASGLMPKMFPLTDAEKVLEGKLETLHMEVDGISRQLPYLANEVALKRRERFGPIRSFCASVSARKFVLSKNTEDINEMVNWTKQLSRKLDSVRTSVLTEEAPSASPKVLPASPEPLPQL